MSELLISDWVVELLEDWDAELPLVRDLGDSFVIREFVMVTFIIGASVAENSVVGESVGGSLSGAGSSTHTSVKTETIISISSQEQK